MCPPQLLKPVLAYLNVDPSANFCFEYAGPVTFIAISRVSAFVAFRMGWILFVAPEALAVPPASAFGVVFATFGLGLTDFTVFWN
jgi:hypothetical protein